MRHIRSLFTITSCTVAAIALSACAFSSQPFYYKTGQQANVATCSGPSWVDCYEKASKECQSSGYEVLERSSNRVSGFFSASDFKEIIYVCNNKAETPK